MRKIKFRYWNGKKMLGQEAIINHLNKYIARNDEYLMQSTGLFDINGAEIYEGDVVKHSTIKKNLTVEYIKNKCKFEAVKKQEGEFDVMYNLTEDMASKRLEVIGNIYENKELLDD